MFEFISERIGNVFERFRKQQNLSADNIRDGLKEVRRALLEADVAVDVVREFLSRVETKAVGQELISGVTPAQQVVQVVHDELIAMMGATDSDLPFADAKDGPTVQRWSMVDMAFERAFTRFLPLAELRALPELSAMLLFQRSRLSVQPVAAEHFAIIENLGG